MWLTKPQIYVFIFAIIILLITWNWPSQGWLASLVITTMLFSGFAFCLESHVTKWFKRAGIAPKQYPKMLWGFCGVWTLVCWREFSSSVDWRLAGALALVNSLVFFVILFDALCAADKEARARQQPQKTPSP